MKLDAARQLAFQAVKDIVDNLSPPPDVCWENRQLLDLDKQQDAFVDVAFHVGNAAQMSLGETKVMRRLGQIVILIAARQGAGTAQLWTLADAFVDGLQARNISGLELQDASPRAAYDENGWHYLPVVVPLWFDDIVTG